MTDISKNIEQYIQHIRTSQKSVFRKAYSGKSRTAGIKAKCLDCCNRQRGEVANCNIETCPLHPYRPFNCQKALENNTFQKKR